MNKHLIRFPYQAIYQKHGLLYNKRVSTSGFTTRPTSRPSVPRLLNKKKDFYKTNGLKSVVEHKKLVLTDWSCFYLCSDPQIKLCEHLFKTFELYIVKNGKLVKIEKLADIKSMMLEIEPVSSEEVKKAYLNEELTADNVEELDYFKTRELLADLQRTKSYDPENQYQALFAEPGYFAFNDIKDMDEKRFQKFLKILADKKEKMEGIVIDDEYPNLIDYLVAFFKNSPPKKIKLTRKAYEKFSDDLFYGELSKNLDITEIHLVECPLQASEIIELLKRFPNLKSLKLENCLIEGEFSEETFPQLEKLVLRECKISKFFIEPFITFPNVTQFEYSGSGVTPQLLSSAKLKSINWKNKRLDTTEIFKSSSFPNLEDVDFLSVGGRVSEETSDQLKLIKNLEFSNVQLTINFLMNFSELKKLSLSNAAVANVDFVSLSGKTWPSLTQLNLEDTDMHEAVINLLPQFPCLQELTIAKSEDYEDHQEDVSSLVSAYDQLKKPTQLRTFFSRDSYPFFLAKIISCSPYLEELSIEKCGLADSEGDLSSMDLLINSWDALPGKTSLKKLSWTQGYINLDAINRFLKISPGLTELYFDSGWVGGVNLGGIFTESFPQLTKLSLERDFNANDEETILSLFRHFPKLKELSVGSFKVNDDGIQLFSLLHRKGIVLSHVEKLNYPVRLNFTSLEHIETVCPNLVELKIQGDLNISRPFPSLKILVIEFATITMESLEKILKNCPNLEVLELRGCEFKKPTEKLNLNLPALKKLVLFGDNKLITKVFYDYLFSSTPNLKYLETSIEHTDRMKDHLLSMPHLKKAILSKEFIKEIFEKEKKEKSDNSLDVANNAIALLDADTESKPIKYKLDTYFLRKKSGYPRPEMYRLNVKRYKVFADEEIPEEKLERFPIDPPRQKRLRQYYDQNYKDDPQHFYAKIPLTMEPGYNYCLPSLNPAEEMKFFSECDGLVDVSYSPNDNFYYVKLKDEVKESKNVDIEFIIRSTSPLPLDKLVDYVEPAPKVANVGIDPLPFPPMQAAPVQVVSHLDKPALIDFKSAGIPPGFPLSLPMDAESDERVSRSEQIENLNLSLPLFSLNASSDEDESHQMAPFDFKFADSDLPPPLPMSAVPDTATPQFNQNANKMVLTEDVMQKKFDYKRLIEFYEPGRGEVKVRFKSPLDAFARMFPFTFLQDFARYIENTFESNAIGALEGAPLLNALLQKTTGACRHRSLLFQKVAEALEIRDEQNESYEIPNRIIDNRAHNYIEMCHPLHADLGWVKVDLGGYPASFDAEPFPSSSSLLEKKFNEATKAQPETNAESKLNFSMHEEKEADEDKASENKVGEDKAAKKKVTEGEVNNFAAYFARLEAELKQLPAGRENILCAFDTPEDILKFNQQLRHYLKSKNKKLHTIYDLDDINDQEPIVTADGEIIYSDSPLVNFLKASEHEDVLVADWSNFKPEHIGYNTLLDDDRKLGATPIKKDMWVFGTILTSKMDRMREDFYSRYAKIEKFPSHLLPAGDLFNGLVSQMEEEKEVKGIDLYHNEDFDDELIGIMAEKGKLVSILEKMQQRSGKDEKEIAPNEIVLINPPDTEKFRLFLFDLTQNKKLRFNGQDYVLPDNVTIKLMERVYTFDGNYTIETTEQFRNDWDCPLNVETYNIFFDRYHTTKRLDGLFKQNAKKSLTLYVTDMFSEDELARLIAEANLHKVKIHFVVSPGISLPKIMLKKSKKLETMGMDLKEEKVLSTAIHTIISSDINAVAQSVREKNKIDHVFSISPNFGYHELIDHTSIEKHEAKGGYIFKNQLGTIAKLLLNNETVLLKGKLSDDLSKQLETLFAKEPYLMLDGARVRVGGRLIIVTDDEALYPFADAEKINIIKPPKLEEVKEIKVSAQVEQKSESVVTKIANVLRRECCVYVDGASASGKTTLLEYSLPDYYKKHIDPKLKSFQGLHQVEAWALEKGDETHLLRIDDADLEVDGSFDFIKNLFDQPPGFFKSNGEWIAIPANKKIIFTGNSADKLQHIEHAVFKEHAVTVSLPEPDKDYYLNIILRPTLSVICSYLPEELRQKISDLFLHYFENYKSKNIPLTARNLESMVRRLDAFKEDDQPFTADIWLKARMAVYDEMHGFLDKQERSKLKQDLFKDVTHYEKIKMELLATKHKSMDTQEDKKSESDYILSNSRHKLWGQLDALIKMRNARIQHAKALATMPLEMDLDASEEEKKTKEQVTNAIIAKNGIRGLLIEGPSGIGKSALALEYLASRQLRVNVDYYHLTPTNLEKMEETLRKAAQEGKIVVIDEINTLPPLMKLMKELMPGHAGFAVIGTLNPASFQNRHALPKWFKNRFQSLRLKKYSREELINIIKGKGMNDAQAMAHVDMHEQELKQTVGQFQPTQRTLFRKVAEVRKREQQDSSPLAMNTHQLEGRSHKRKLQVSNQVEDKKIKEEQSKDKQSSKKSRNS